MHSPGLSQGMQHCSKGRMSLVSWNTSAPPHFVRDREKISSGMILSGRTRYLRYYLFISGTKPPLREETDHGPDDNNLFLLIPIFLLRQPESSAQKMMATRPGWEPDKKASRIVCCHTWHADSAALVRQQRFSCVPWQVINIHKCKHKQQPPGLLHAAWQAA